MSQEKGLASGSLGTLESAVMGVAGSAPAFSVAVTTAVIVASVGVLSVGSVLYCGLIMFGILLDSFTQFPIGKNLMTQDVYGKMLAWSAMMFLASVLIALPVLMTLLFVNVGLGFVTRAAPSLNIFSVGFSAMLMAGFVILWLALPSTIGRMNWLWVQTYAQMRALFLG